MSEQIHNNEQEELNPNEAKIEKYKDLLGNTEAIFSLDADIKRRGNVDSGNFRATSYMDLDAHGYLAGGHARIIAAAELAKYFPDIKIVTDSYYKEDEPSHAEIYKRELMNLGIPESQIEMEKKSKSTLGELIEMVKMAKTKDWKDVAILTSDYHIDRVKFLMENLKPIAEKFKKADEDFVEAWRFFDEGKELNVKFLSAEDILPERNERYAEIIKIVTQSKPYSERVESEKKGIAEMKAGIIDINRNQ